MDALKQYITLFQENKPTIERLSTAPQNALRQRALKSLEACGSLPSKGENGYSTIAPNDMFAPDYGININRLELKVDASASFHCGVPNLSTLLGLVINDRFAPTSTLVKNLPEGLTVCRFADAGELLPDVLKRYLGSVADINNPSTALNTLLGQEGVLIHVAPGVKIEKAVQLVSIARAEFPMLSLRRLLVIAEEDAKLSVLKCDHTQPTGFPCMNSEVIEIIVGKNAEVGFYDIEEASATTSRLCQLYCRQMQDSKLNIGTFTLHNGKTRNEMTIDAAGNNTVTYMAGMGIAAGQQIIDNATFMRHNAKGGHSNQLFKYVLDDNSRGSFTGEINVAHGAQFVEAYQSNRNVLASESAMMHSEPTLLIYNDDVKCSHGATTGQLDPNAIFYMQTRGIPQDEARKLLMQAFMIDIVDSVRLEPLRDRLRHLVESRFADCTTRDTACNDCHKQ